VHDPNNAATAHRPLVVRLSGTFVLIAVEDKSEHVLQ
jgi:hypothetical protein